MDLSSYALVNLADTKTFLGTTSLSDDQIKLFINMATDLIETATGRRLKTTTYTAEVFDGNGEKELLLPQYPVTAFTSLEKNGALDNSSSWETVDTDQYWRSDDEGRLIGVARFACGVGNYRATFVAGYTSIPYDLQFACMKLVQLLGFSYKANGIESERLGDHSVVFSKSAMDPESDPMIKKVIDKYKKPIL